MAFITILVGLVLVALGAIGYLPTEKPTALIPAGFGVLLLALGALAFQEKMRKHAMHAAVMVGMIGLIGGGVMAILAAVNGTISEHQRAFTMQVCMAVTCAIFVALCIKSFIEARRRREMAGKD